MNDLAFYYAGGHGAKGFRHLPVLVRRLVRRILWPIFLRQVEIFQALIVRLDRLESRVETHDHAVFALRVDTDKLTEQHQELAKRQEEAAEQLQTALAFGWDYVAFVRRLATLEDLVAASTGTSLTAASENADAHPSILFPGLAKATRKPGSDTTPEVHSRVS